MNYYVKSRVINGFLHFRPGSNVPFGQWITSELAYITLWLFELFIANISNKTQHKWRKLKLTVFIFFSFVETTFYFYSFCVHAIIFLSKNWIQNMVKASSSSVTMLLYVANFSVWQALEHLLYLYSWYGYDFSVFVYKIAKLQSKYIFSMIRMPRNKNNLKVLYNMTIMGTFSLDYTTFWIFQFQSQLT